MFFTLSLHDTCAQSAVYIGALESAVLAASQWLNDLKQAWRFYGPIDSPKHPGFQKPLPVSLLDPPSLRSLDRPEFRSLAAPHGACWIIG